MKREIVVIGAGVVGLATSYALVRMGHAVRLVDRRKTVGEEASFANGGQLSYRYVSPLADRGVVRDAMGWLARRDAPVSLRLAADPQQWAWLWAFIRACNRATNRKNTGALLELALRSQIGLDQWRPDLDDFCWRRPGKLVVYRNPKGLAKARSAVRAGGLEQVLDARQCIATEPAFADLERELAGGIFSPQDEVADCHLFCKALLAALSRHGDFTFVDGDAELIDVGAGRCVAVVEGQMLSGDTIVLAAGLTSRRIARAVGIDLPLYGLGGYSLTLGGESKSLPSVSVTDFDNRVVYARLGEKLRVAAMVDIGPVSAQRQAERIASLRSLAVRTLPGVKLHDMAPPWIGVRPATPDGLPIIGQTRFTNLLTNVGHGPLGFTLAVGAAQKIADIIGES